MQLHSEDRLNELIKQWLDEDIGEGDHTSMSVISSGSAGKARLLVKQAGIIAGVRIAGKIFNLSDERLSHEVFIMDGSSVKPGDVVFEVRGPVRSILQTERLVLNVMQRMSGIATQTFEYVSRLKGLKTVVLDTRKTSPGLRLIEKEAVRIGGGQNHRDGLYDMILIKDNHIDYAGGISHALHHVHKYLKEKKKDLKIEIEARSLDDVREILRTGGVHRIMLDNFSPEATCEAVSLIKGSYEIESSGMINLDNIRQYAECGVDCISVGALTHQIRSLDMSLKAFF